MCVCVCVSCLCRVLRSVTYTLEKGKNIAADLLEAAAADIEFRAGNYVVAGTDRMIGIFAVAKAARDGKGPALDGEAEFLPEVATFPNGAHICELEIDADTGSTAVVRAIGAVGVFYFVQFFFFFFLGEQSTTRSLAAWARVMRLVKLWLS